MLRFAIRKFSIFASVFLMLAISAPAVVFAASPEFTALQKFDFDKTVSAADAPLADKLSQQFRDFMAFKEQNRSWGEKAGALHYRNEDRAALLRKRIALIDAAKLNSLKGQVEQTKKKYKPMFELYTSVNKQLALARKVKSKPMTALLQAQAEGLKFTVQLARADIKGKQAAHTAAKNTAYAAMKKARETLSGIDPIRVQYKAAKTGLTAPKDSRASIWKTFTQAIKKREAKSASDLFASINSLSRQLIEQEQKMYQLETRIADLLNKTEAQIPH